MAENKYISVKICGSAVPNLGYETLIMCNNPNIDIKDRNYDGMGKNSYFFSICIEQKQIVYSLIKNYIRAHGSIRPSNLTIALSIPRGYRLAGDVSPYDALIDLKDTFLQECLICRDEIIETYEFKEERPDLDVLDETAKKYPLVEFPSPWHIMPKSAPIGCLITAENSVKELMRDVQYQEFEKYSEVLVADTVNGSFRFTPIVGLEIPRKQEYNIIVDGKPCRKTNNIKETISISLDNDSRIYRCKDIRFTVNDLLNGDIIEGVTLDGQKETINVSTVAYLKPRESKDLFELIICVDAKNKILFNDGISNTGMNSKIEVKETNSDYIVSTSLDKALIKSLEDNKKATTNSYFTIKVPIFNKNKNAYHITIKTCGHVCTQRIHYDEAKDYGRKEVNFSDFKRVSIPKIIKYRPYFLLFIGLVIGVLLTGVISMSLCNGKTSNQTLCYDSAYVDQPELYTMSDFDKKALLRGFDETLRKENLSFEEVNQMYTTLQNGIGNVETSDSLYQICSRIEKYNKAVKSIEGGSFDDLKKYAKGGLLYPYHERCVRYIVEEHELQGPRTSIYEEKSIRDSFLHNHDKIKKFSDLLSIRSFSHSTAKQSKKIRSNHIPEL